MRPKNKKAAFDRPASNAFSAALLAGIFAGGTLGSAARLLLCEAFPQEARFAAIFIANFAGCVGISCVIFHTRRLSAERRAFFATGICGGLTTFSAHVADVLSFAHSGCPGAAALCLLGTLLCSLLGVVAGLGALKLGAALRLAILRKINKKR